MATRDLTVNVSGNIPWDGVGKIYYRKKRVDFSLELGTAAAHDCLQCLEIPAMTHVINVGIKNVTAEGSTCTAIVGDGSGTASWIASADLNTSGVVTLGNTGTGGAAYSKIGGKAYLAADTIDIAPQNAGTAAKFDVFAICVDLN